VTAISERTNGSSAGLVDLPQRVGSKRAVRLPELAVGLLLVAGGALVGLLLFLNADRKQPAAAFATSVRAGEVIEHSDLKVVYLASDDGLATIRPAAAAAFIGKRAVHDVAAGSLLSAGVVSSGPSIGADEGVVAVLVPAAARPSSALQVGDVVNAVIPSGTDGEEATVVERATVHAVERLETDDSLVVSLRTTVDAAGVIASADPARIRLVLVAAG
jgi:hypothetical protein